MGWIDGPSYPWDREEGRKLHEELQLHFPTVDDLRRVVANSCGGATLLQIDLAGSIDNVWRRLLDHVVRRVAEPSPHRPVDGANPVLLRLLLAYIRKDERIPDAFARFLDVVLAADALAPRVGHELHGLVGALDTHVAGTMVSGAGVGPPGMSPFLLGPLLQGVAQRYAPRVDIADLFEIVSDADEVLPTLYGTVRSPLVPYATEYVAAREGTLDTRVVLRAALGETGRLLVSSIAGVGKTREAGELAREMCEEGWTVCIARPDVDLRMGALERVPQRLVDSKLLVVIDALHARVLQDVRDGDGYLARLDALLDDLARFAASVKVIATARSEARATSALGLGMTDVAWRGFTVHQLEHLTTEGLAALLRSCAELVGVAVEQPDVLVANSDRTPGTVVSNVRFALQRKQRVTAATWRPSAGESWRERLTSVERSSPQVRSVFRAIALVAKLGVPVRRAYVVALGVPEAGIESLRDAGLLGERTGVLSAFSEEQMQDAARGEVLALGDHADALERCIDAEDRLALALGFLRADLDSRAEANARAAIELDPTRSLGWKIAGVARVAQGDFAGGAAFMERAVEVDPRDPVIRAMRGALRANLGDFDGALADLSVAIAATPSPPDTLECRSVRAAILYARKDWSGVVADLDLVIERDSRGAERYLRAFARFQLGDLAGCEADLDAAIDAGISLELPVGVRPVRAGIDPPDWQVPLRAMRGEVRLRLGKYADARTDLAFALEHGVAVQLERIVANSPDLPGPRALLSSEAPSFDDAWLAVRLGQVLAELRDWTAAEASLTSALPALPPDLRPEVHALRGIARLSLDDREGAEADLTAAIAGGNAAGGLYLRRGILRLFRGAYQDALDDLASAWAAGERGVALHRARGLARIELDRDLEDAEADLGRVLSEVTSDPYVWAYRGAARWRLGRPEGAIADAEAALALDPRHALALFVRGVTRADAEDFAGARPDLEQAIEAGLTVPRVRHALAHVLHRLGDHEGAIAQATLLAQVVDDVDVYWLRARANHASERLVGAIDDASRVLAVATDAHVLHLRGDALRQLGRHEEAVRDFSSSLACSEDAEVRALRGRSQLVLGRFAEARDDLTRALAVREDHANRAYLAFARYGLGDMPGALADCTAAVAGGLPEHALLVLATNARLRVESVEAAEDACLRAADCAERDTALGLVQLARGDRAGAAVRFAAGAAADPTGLVWCGLATAIAGDPRALVDYGRWAATCARDDVMLAIADLDHWVARVELGPEGPVLVAMVRQRLAGLLG